MTAVNLGDDADTTGAICGQLAGAIWGASAIPDRWMEKLAWRRGLEAMATCLMDRPAKPTREWTANAQSAEAMR